MATDKQNAIQDCLDEVIRHVQPDEKKTLDDDYDAIVTQLIKKNEYEQSDEGLRIVAEFHEMVVVLSYRKKIKKTSSADQK